MDINNTVYVTGLLLLSYIQVWPEGSATPTQVISGGLNLSYSIFVTLNGDIYVDNGAYNHRVDKWTRSSTNSTIAMYVNDPCFSLFIDSNENLYCSVTSLHRVIRHSLVSVPNTSVVVAGNGIAGLTANSLNIPIGIFVDMNLNLYVADYGNNRIQFFRSGQLGGTTVAINGSNGMFNLSRPTDVVLDSDGYLFIVDEANNRILGSGSTGFRCIIGCFRGNGSISNPLNYPRSLRFDSYGNLIVMGSGNSDLQKFLLASNSCGEFPRFLTSCT